MLFSELFREESTSNAQVRGRGSRGRIASGRGSSGGRGSRGVRGAISRGSRGGRRGGRGGSTVPMSREQATSGNTFSINLYLISFEFSLQC